MNECPEKTGMTKCNVNARRPRTSRVQEIFFEKDESKQSPPSESDDVCAAWVSSPAPAVTSSSALGRERLGQYGHLCSLLHLHGSPLPRLRGGAVPCPTHGGMATSNRSTASPRGKARTPLTGTKRIRLRRL